MVSQVEISLSLSHTFLVLSKVDRHCGLIGGTGHSLVSKGSSPERCNLDMYFPLALISVPGKGQTFGTRMHGGAAS